VFVHTRLFTFKKNIEITVVVEPVDMCTTGAMRTFAPRDGGSALEKAPYWGCALCTYPQATLWITRGLIHRQNRAEKRTNVRRQDWGVTARGAKMWVAADRG